MGSNSINLPVIDFSCQDLKPGTPAWNSIKVEVRKALEEFGCFKALYDKIPTEIRKAFFDTFKEYFDLPYENKATYYFEQERFRGYAETIPFEALTILEPHLFEKVEKCFTNVIWPQGNSKVSKAIHAYSEQLSKFEKTIRRIVLESLGLEKYLDEHMDFSTYFLRFNKFKAPQTIDAKLAFDPHTDKTILSILDENNAKGLQILRKDGQWTEVNYSPNSFTVLGGEVFHAWTNGRLHSPIHRVMMTGNDARYSVGLFSHPIGGIIKPLEEFVDEEHPQLYKPFDYAKFVAFAYSDDGLKCDSVLKAYCGV